MSLLKILGLSLLVIFVLGVAVAALWYYLYLTPAKRAEKHLRYVHQSIADMHPAMLEDGAEGFRRIHSQSFEQALARLPAVHSTRDITALINFYLAPYEDRHLQGAVARSPFTRIETSANHWAGWVLRATPTGYEVSYSLGGDRYPPVGAHLITCNQQPVDDFLRTHYAPYRDLRWSILNARDQAAKLLTLDTARYSALQRPTIRECVFLAPNGNTVTVDFAWLAADVTILNNLRQHLYPDYRFPRLEQIAPNVHWAYVTDFQLNSTEAYNSHKQLLKDLQALYQANDQHQVVILDTRSNNGGSSTFGQEIMEALLGQSNYEFIAYQLQTKLKGEDALFRASWPLYWSYDYQAKQARGHHGETSSMVQYLDALVDLTRSTLEKGEDFFWQSELNMETDPHEAASPEQAPDWTERGKILLLTDKHCMSACLDFVDLARQIPNLVHLGEPTDADTAYTQVAGMWHEYYKEAYGFAAPIKKWNKRLRDDNEPYIPDVLYSGDINNTEALQAWALEQL